MIRMVIIRSEKSIQPSYECIQKIAQQPQTLKFFINSMTDPTNRIWLQLVMRNY